MGETISLSVSSNPHILIVDDDESTRRTLEMIFEKRGYRTEVAATGQVALERAQSYAFDVAILDIRLPDMKGVELLLPLKQMHPDIAVIIATGYASVKTAVQALNHGASAYVTKPLDMDEVLAKFEDLLERQRLVRDKRQAEAALRERVKEMTCLYAVSHDMQGDLPAGQLCQRIIEHLVPAMQFPEITIPVVELDGQRFRSGRSAEGLSHSLRAEISVEGKVRGYVWVYYTQERPFLIPEEQDLINGVAEALGQWLQRKRVEEALRKSEKRYRNLFERMPVGLYRTTPEGRILHANQALVEMLGYPDRQTLMQVNVGDLYADPREREREEELLAREGIVHGFEMRLRRRDGSVIWVRDTVQAVRGISRNAVYYEGSLQDITDRKRAEETLQQRLTYERLLSRISTLTVEVENLDIFQNECVKHMGEILDVSRVYIFEHRYETDTMDNTFEWVAPGVSVQKEQLQDVPAESFPWWIKTLNEGEMISFEDIENIPDEGTRELLRSQGILSILVVPLFVAGQYHGFIGFDECRRHREWPTEDVALLRTIARIISSVTERKRAEEALRRYIERLRILRAIDGAMLAAWSPEKIAQSALRHMQQLVPYGWADVVLFDRDRQEASMLITYTDDTFEMGKETSFPLEEIRDLGAMAQGGVRVVEDILDHPESPVGVHIPDNLRAYVAAPLIAQGRLVGLLELGADTPDIFTPEHVDIALEVTNQIALALHQARLQKQAQYHLTELEQRVAERTMELSAVNAELARASRLKDEFLASMSHELRTPLNAILGLSEALQEEVYGPLTERQIRSLHTIEESGRHLLTLINDILDVSKIEAGKVELNIGPVSIESVCRACIGLIKQEAHKKRLHVSTHFDNQTLTIQADVRRLKQILVNLLSNAVKFTPKGGEIGLDVTSDAEREAVHFTVWDTGIGIAPQDMDRLFQPFTQLDSSLSRHHAGTGLGLVLVRRMAEMHGGGVAVESELGEGSRFTVSLPWEGPEPVLSPSVGDEGSTPDAKRPVRARHPASLEEGPEDESKTVVTAPFSARQPLILLAEDNESNIQTVSEYLRVRGYRVTVARNGAEAIERAAEETPALILMDIQMPKMNGLEATRHMRGDADLAHVPIVALTALAMPGDRERCLAAGADEYLSKPVALKGLVHVIEAQLSQCTAAETERDHESFFGEVEGSG